MNPYIRNQRGVTLLTLLISMSIIMILGYLLFSNSGLGGGGSVRSKKEKALGAQCQATMSAISISVQTRLLSNQPLETLDDLIEEDPALKSHIYNDSLWAENGYPVLELTGDTSFLISAYCVDGNLYTYDSTGDGLESEKWR